MENVSEGEVMKCCYRAYIGFPFWMAYFQVVSLLLVSGRCNQQQECTPLKTNMSPENQWLADVFPIKILPFKGTFVSFQGCTSLFFSGLCVRKIEGFDDESMRISNGSVVAVTLTFQDHDHSSATRE